LAVNHPYVDWLYAISLSSIVTQTSITGSDFQLKISQHFLTKLSFQGMMKNYVFYFGLTILLFEATKNVDGVGLRRGFLTRIKFIIRFRTQGTEISI
jgi:hypothetical protein